MVEVDESAVAGPEDGVVGDGCAGYRHPREDMNLQHTPSGLTQDSSIAMCEWLAGHLSGPMSWLMLAGMCIIGDDTARHD